MVATQFFTKKTEKKKLLNPFVYYSVIRILLIKELWESPVMITLILFLVLYLLLKSFSATPKPPIVPPRTIEIDEIKDCIIEEERMIILVANRRMYEIFWSDFSSYRIYGRMLFLVKTDRSGIIKLDETTIGARFFQSIFLEVMERF